MMRKQRVTPEVVRTRCFLKVGRSHLGLTFRDDGMFRSMLAMSFIMPSAVVLSSRASSLTRVAWFPKPFTWAEALSYLNTETP